MAVRAAEVPVAEMIEHGEEQSCDAKHVSGDTRSWLTNRWFCMTSSVSIWPPLERRFR
jgi:hypothetical protein